MCDEITALLERIRRVQEKSGCTGEFIFTDGKGGCINGQRISDCAKRLTNTTRRTLRRNRKSSRTETPKSLPWLENLK